MKQYDPIAAERIVVATGILLSQDLGVEIPDEGFPAMFSFSGFDVGAKALAAAARKRNTDVIHLHFTPGDEVEGPANITVCAHQDGKLSTWLNCQIWGRSFSGPFGLIPRDENFCFFFDGFGLHAAPGGPTPQDLVTGITLAKAALRFVALRVPSEIEKRPMH